MEDFTLITEIKNAPLIDLPGIWRWQEGIDLTFRSDRRDIMAEIKQELNARSHYRGGRLYPDT